ncbi:AraC family transcriptional regulator [Ruminococcus callidus]|uniref:AraC family transcriptional regulator n=1 Tax=Ruminococcus callidus TaxID=40519 RepID=UPI0023F19ACB|nr:AraC family transcriptional regulator [Ruminococcus callidus]
METQESGLKTVENAYMESRRILRTPSALARDALLYVQEIGEMTCKEPRQNWRNSLDSYLLILVEEGCGTVTVGEETLALQEGDVAFLDCHQPYSHCCDAREPWKILWVHWNGQVMPHLYEVFRQRNVSVVLSGAADWVEPVLLRLESIAREEAPDYELYESECLTQLMTLLLTKKPERGGHASGETLQKWEQIHQYLEEHFAEKITLEDLGKRFSVSKYYMLRGFKRRYSVTIVQFINQCRMNYAKNELRFTDKQIDTIAEECGIHDSSYFNRIFRTTEGISAGAYRRQWRN